MHKLLISSFILMLTFKAAAQDEKIQKIEIKTSAICEMCQFAIEKEMAFEKGVKSASLDLDTKLLTVMYNDKKTSSELIRKRVALTGYHADDIPRDSAAYTNLPKCCQDGAHENDEN
ncbi:MAG: mercuric ion binding protein [Cyclobacteriaceae bacterium]|jgi:mercuric ion binding protein